MPMQEVPPIPDFHLEEYKSLRAEMMAAQAERRLIDRFGATAMIGIYAWLLTAGARHVPQALFGIAVFLPSVVSLVCFLLGRRLSDGIRSAGTYLAHLERIYADPRVGGWEYTLSHLRHEGRLPQADSPTTPWLGEKLKLDRLSRLSARFWSWSLGVTLGFGIILNAALASGAFTLGGSP